MENYKIKYYTIKIINGKRYFSKKQISDLKDTVCLDMGIERTKETEMVIENAIDTYFSASNKYNL